MKSVGSKSLMSIKIDNHNDAVIKHQLASIRKYVKKIASISVVLGFDRDKLKKKIHFGNDVKVIENDHYEDYGQSYAIGLALKQIDNNYPTIIISNYTILRKNIFQQCNNNSNHIFCIKNCTNKFFKIGCTHNDGQVEYLCYELTPKWSEIFMLQANSKTLLESIIDTNNNMLFFESINMLLPLFPTINNYIYNNSLITVNHK
jgi:hypothetical protein